MERYKFSKYVNATLQSFLKELPQNIATQNSYLSQNIDSEPLSPIITENLSINSDKVAVNKKIDKNKNEATELCSFENTDKQIRNLSSMLQETLINMESHSGAIDFLNGLLKNNEENDIINIFKNISFNTENSRSEDIVNLGFIIFEDFKDSHLFINYYKFCLMPILLKDSNEGLQLFEVYKNSDKTEILLEIFARHFLVEQSMGKSLQKYLKECNDSHKAVLLGKFLKLFTETEGVDTHFIVLVIELLILDDNVNSKVLKEIILVLHSKCTSTNVPCNFPKILNELAMKTPKSQRHIFLNDFKILNSSNKQSMWRKKLQKQLESWEVASQMTFYNNTYNLSESLR